MSPTEQPDSGAAPRRAAPAPLQEPPARSQDEQDPQQGSHDPQQAQDRPEVEAPPAVERPDNRRQGHRKRRALPAWAEMPVLIGLALLLAMLVKAFLVQAFYIPSGSMEQTLQVGDRVLVDKVSYRFGDIERGDIVVFNGVDSFATETEIEEPGNPVAGALQTVGSWIGIAPPDERDFIKRVIGLPGDRVTADGRGAVEVNGVPLDEESYLFPGDRPSDREFDVEVPEGKLWVLGDHRSASADSREHLGDPGGGFVPMERVIGKAFVVVWPLGNWRTLGTPETFEDPALQSAG